MGEDNIMKFSSKKKLIILLAIFAFLLLGYCVPYIYLRKSGKLMLAQHSSLGALNGSYCIRELKANTLHANTPLLSFYAPMSFIEIQCRTFTGYLPEEAYTPDKVSDAELKEVEMAIVRKEPKTEQYGGRSQIQAGKSCK